MRLLHRRLLARLLALLLIICAYVCICIRIASQGFFNGIGLSSLEEANLWGARPILQPTFFSCQQASASNGPVLCGRLC